MQGTKWTQYGGLFVEMDSSPAIDSMLWIQWTLTCSSAIASLLSLDSDWIQFRSDPRKTRLLWLLKLFQQQDWYPCFSLLIGESWANVMLDQWAFVVEVGDCKIWYPTPSLLRRMRSQLAASGCYRLRSAEILIDQRLPTTAFSNARRRLCQWVLPSLPHPSYATTTFRLWTKRIEPHTLIWSLRP